MMFRQSYRSPVLIAVLLTAAVMPWPGCSAVAQDEASETPATKQSAGEVVEPSDTRTNSSSDADFESTETADPALRTIDEKERLRASARKSAMAGLLVLSLICIVFLVLIVVVALWARRIRMLTRQPLPEQHPGDPLWYLRKGKGSDSSDVAKVADGGSSHGES
jgi:hypothetical protein